jgi:RNA polymerase primary sigma factor
MSGIKVGRNSGEVRMTQRTPALNEYLKGVSDIKKFKTADEEYDCALRALNGDDKARVDLITRNLRFVISVAKQYQSKNAPLEELINEGNVGLVEAADKFDPTKGFKFISYAVWYVRRSINDYLKGKSRLVRIPVNRTNELNMIKKEINKLEQTLCREVYPEDIDNLPSDKFDNKRLNLLMEIQNSSSSSLDMPIGGEDNNNNHYDILSDNSNNPTDYLISCEIQKESIYNLFNILTEKQSTIMVLLFGLDNGIEKNLIEVSEIVGMSREGVRQIREKSLKKLRDHGLNIGYNVEMFDIM